MSVVGQAFIEIVPDTGKFASKLSKDVKESVDKAETETSGTFNRLAGVGQAALLGIGTAAITAGTFAVHMADKYEEAHARLQTAVENSGHTMGEFSKTIGAQTSSFAGLGITSDQYQGALARLTQAINDPKKALGEMGVVADVAAARHIDLETAATLVGKVSQGNTAILKRYGIDLGLSAGGAKALATANDGLNKANENLATVEAKVHDGRLKGVAADEALKKAHEQVAAATEKVKTASDAGAVAIAALGERFSGSAAAQADTFHGKIAALEAQGKNLAITVGLVLIPFLEKLGTVLFDGVQFLEKHRAVALGLGIVVGTVLVVAIGAYIVSMIAAAVATLAAAAPFIAIAAAVAAVAAGVIYAYTHWEFFRVAVQAVITFVVDTLWPALKKTGEILGVVFGAILAAAQTAFGGIGTAIQWFIDHPVAFVREQIQLFQAWWNAHWDEIRIIFVAIFDAISTYVRVWWEVVSTIFRVALAVILPIVEVAWQYLQGVFHVAFDVVAGIVRAAWDVIRGVFQTSRDLILGIVGVFLDLLTGKWGRAWNDLKGAVSSVLGDINGTISRLLGDIVGTIGRVAADMYRAAIGVGTSIVNGILKGLEGLLGSVGGALQHALSGAVNQLPGPIKSAVHAIIGFAEGGLVPGLPGEPRLAIVHGGEFVLSRQMLTGAGLPSAASGSTVRSAPSVTVEATITQTFTGPTTPAELRAAMVDVLDGHLSEVVRRAVAGAGRVP